MRWQHHQWYKSSLVMIYITCDIFNKNILSNLSNHWTMTSLQKICHYKFIVSKREIITSDERIDRTHGNRRSQMPQTIEILLAACLGLYHSLMNSSKNWHWLAPQVHLISKNSAIEINPRLIKSCQSKVYKRYQKEIEEK